MDKRAGSRLVFSRRGLDIASKDPKGNNGSIQCCNRIGCSTRYYTMEGTETRNRGKATHPRPSFGSKTNNTTVEPSSGSSSSSSTYHKKLHQERLNRAVVPKLGIGEKGSRSREIDFFETNNREATSGEIGSSRVLHGLSENVTKTSENNRAVLSSKTRAQIDRKFVSGNQDTSSSSLSVRRPVASRNTSYANERASGSAGYSVSAHPAISRTVDLVRKRSSDAMSSMTRTRNVDPRTSLPNTGFSGSRHRGHFPMRRLVPQQASRSDRNWPTSRIGATTIKTERAPIRGTRIRSSTQGNFNSLPRMQHSTSKLVPQSSARSSHSELPSTSRRTFGRGGFTIRTSYSRPASTFYSPSRDGDDYENSEEISQLLLETLESFEQNEERSITLGGLPFYDQHRAMRMDIDDMSYEELLVLEEEIGIVSTALSEEELLVCLKRSIYAPATLSSCCGDDNARCSICQEEYVAGDEVGKLAQCKHQYHMACIHQWLKLKNWCPVCKSPASPS